MTVFDVGWALYASPPEVHRGNLDIAMSFLSGDLEASELINEELSDSTAHYYGKVRGDDELVWRRFLESTSVLWERCPDLSRSYIYNWSRKWRSVVTILRNSETPGKLKISKILGRVEIVSLL